MAALLGNFGLRLLRSVTNMAQGIFITGTDTGVGKTTVACALLRAYAAQGLRAIGMKPVAAGIAAGAACNDDVAVLDPGQTRFKFECG